MLVANKDGNIFVRLSEVPPAIILGTAADNRWRNRKSYAGGRYED
jgi:hypothetical protein